NLIDFVYRHKTADLFVAAAKMGALAAGADDKTVEKLASFALNLGLAFQYQDDLLDADGAFPKDLTEKLATEKTAAAISFLDQLEGDTSFLRNLANLLVGRNV
ncbi:MAG: polyprenyl synthetase family protein, partial [Kiritimatiellae bacterium]|nr:polyprenyl synthetase family protein [Kiritimatiellia bacterium]